MQQQTLADSEVLVLRLIPGCEGIQEVLFSRGTHEVCVAGECHVSLDDLQKGTEEILSSLHHINLHGGENDSVKSPATLGKRWFEHLLESEIRHHIKQTQAEYLILELDALLIPFPWELLHDGTDFLGCRFSMGRQVVGWSSPSGKAHPGEPFLCLILSNPTNDLSESMNEGHQLADLLAQDPRMRVEWFNSRITSNTVMETFPHSNLLHFSGHARMSSQGDCGWLLEDGIFPTQAVDQACEARGAPILVFNNACCAAGLSASDNTRVSGFVEAFIRNGCEHYLGTIGEVIDAGSRLYSMHFYRQLLAGATVGMAVRQARLETRAGLDPHDLTWAQYVLYDDPTISLFGEGVARTEIRTVCRVDLCDKNGGQTHRLEVDIREILLAFPEAEWIETGEDSFILTFSRPSDAVRFALLLAVRRRESDPLGKAPTSHRVVIHSGEMILHRDQVGGPVRHLSGQNFDLIRLLSEIVLPGQILTSKPVFDDSRAILRDSEIGAGIQVSWLDHGPYRLSNWEELVEICEVGERGAAPLEAPPDSSCAWRHIPSYQEPVLGWRPALDQFIPTSPDWVLVEKLGEGGFGEVWKARNAVTNELRVYKFCFRADRVRSLKREASLFHLLRHQVGDHPNIVRLYEVFFDEPPYFIAMEYVPGKDLGAWWKEHGQEELGLETRLKIVASVADVLQVAHDAGIIHRDIKPSNILISGDAETLEIKLGDFGIGRLETNRSLISTPFGGFTETIAPTEMAALSGTRLYMAPELLVGKSTSIRSDIYSLGVVLYQLIVGDLNRPLTADWRLDVGDPLLSEDLEHCLAGEPSARFSSASELSRSLRDIDNRRRRQTVEEHSRRKERLRKQILTAVSSTALLIFLLAGTLGYGLLGEQKAREEAEKELYVSSIKLAEQAITDYRFKQAYDYLMDAPEGYRNWEWGHLLFQCNQDLMTLRGHEGAAKAVTFDPKGRWVASGGSDGTIRIWDSNTGTELDCLHGSYEGVNALAVSSDGDLLAAGCVGHAVEIWDTSQWKVVRVLSGFDGEITSTTFHPYDRRLAVGSLDSTAKIFDTATGTVLSSVSKGKEAVYSVSFSHDGDMLVIGGGCGDLRDYSVWVLEIDPNRLILVLQLGIPVRSVCFSPTDECLAVAGLGNAVQIWNWLTGGLSKTLTGFNQSVSSVLYSPDGNFLSACSCEGIIRIWNTEDWSEKRLITGHTAGVNDIAYSPDGGLLASVGEDRSCRMWMVDPNVRNPFVIRHDVNVSLLSMSPDGKKLASCAVDDPSVQVRDLVTGEIQQEYTGFSDQFSCGDFSPDGRWFAGGGNDKVVHVWDAPSGHQIQTLEAPSPEINSIQFSNDSRWIACGGGDGNIKVWDTSNWHEVSLWKGADARIETVRWSPDGRLLAVGQQAPRALLWDPLTRELSWSIEGHTGPVRSVAFSPDGQYLATTSDDKTAILWDLENRTRLATYEGHVFVVSDAVCPEDGQRLFTTSEDTTCKVWETTKGRDLITLHGQPKPSQRLVYSADQKILASVSTDAIIRLWPAFPWNESQYPGTEKEPFEYRLEAYKRTFWKERYPWPKPTLPTKCPTPDDDNIILSDPVFEKEARYQLSMPKGILTRMDLKRARLLSLKGDRIDLDNLRYFPKLNQIVIDATQVLHATRIAELKQLREITLHNSTVGDLSLLESLPKLKSLNLTNYNRVDLQTISPLKSLEQLSLVDCNLKDIAPLSTFTNLNYLDINTNAIQDLSPLQGLINLQTLVAHHNRIVNVTPLSGLLLLSSLNMCNNPIRNCHHLELLPRISQLDLSECEIDDASPLASIKSLQQVNLSHNPVQSVDFLSRMTGLTHLGLSNTPITDLSPLAGLKNLVSLNVSHCPISDVSPLAGLTQMQDLDLSYTQVADTTPLKNMDNMVKLKLTHTNLIDLTPLIEARFHGGTVLNVGETPAAVHHMDQIERLRESNVNTFLK